MKDIKIDTNRVPIKINSEQLTEQVAAALRVSREDVGVSKAIDSDGSVVMILHIPDNASATDALNAVQAHAPEKNDRETVEDRAIEEFKNHPVIAGILSRIEQLESK